MAMQASDSTKPRPRTSASDDLAVIVQRAQAFTNASGAAIAVSEGNSDEIICRARSGASAPDVGTALRVEGTFTGMCIQSGKELRCDDTETDTRVDATAIRALGIRSMVVTPIKDEGKVIGVLAVFAPTPHAFTITHVAVLKTMADQISGLLQKERRSREEGHSEPAATSPRPPVVATPSPVTMPPLVIKSSTPAPAASVTAAAPARAPITSPPKIEPAKVESLKPVPVAADIAAPVPLPKREERREERRAEHRPEPAPAPAPKAHFSTFDAIADEQKKQGGNKLLLFGGIAALLAAAGGTWAFLSFHKSNPPAQVQTAQSQNVPPPASTTATTAPTTAIENSTSAVSTPAASTPPAPSRPSVSEKVESRRNESAKKNSQEQSKPAPLPAPATVALASGPSKISTGSKAPADQSPNVAPSLSVGGGSSPSLSTLARPVSSSTPAMIAQSELTNAQAIRKVPAVYPLIAKARRISGMVTLKVTIGKDGRVRNPKLMSGPVIFQDAAFEAVSQWIYKPAMLNGQPIEQETEIKINFTPN
jgi:TonB family protein